LGSGYGNAVDRYRITSHFDSVQPCHRCPWAKKQPFAKDQDIEPALEVAAKLAGLSLVGGALGSDRGLPLKQRGKRRGREERPPQPCRNVDQAFVDHRGASPSEPSNRCRP